MTDEMKWDIIVIGGGLAGLTSGAYLAKGGKSVLLLEQQGQPGGCCAAHVSGGRTIPAASHLVNDQELVNGIFRELGAPEIRFTAPDPVFEVTGPCQGKNLVITSNRELFEQSACELVKDTNREAVKQGLGRLIDLSMEIYHETRL
ncbi:MAG: FAD-dependent oxidoreductase [Methanoregulaceae archaeon]|jgi:phytoene dehydrogenase-like protein|nr:FAD-dependent oxidoreductase [Methanoregulaceae archaeon]